MNIKRYVNEKELLKTELSELFIENEIINKTIYIVSERVKNNNKLSVIDIK